MNKLQRQIENAAYRTYNLAGPETLRVNGVSFLDLPYNEKIFVEKGQHHIIKIKHAEDIGVYRFRVVEQDLELTYDPNSFRWV
ncbi:MAG: hypothetical protein Unbinned4311contig1001_47, partial [Prokaryotic dsDNA virus sp.]